MQKLTLNGQQFVNDISARYNLSYDAVMHMLIAVNNGGCSMAQFNCPELGGGGQWMQGGMTMVGDMFNYGLKMTVDNLCNDLANGLSSMQIFAPLPKGSANSNEWWPNDLGQPFSSGAQNNTRYAIFQNRLAVQLNGNVTVYDTLDHNIGGVSQQQGGDDSLTFSSQYGTIAVNSLPLVNGDNSMPDENRNFLNSYDQSLSMPSTPVQFPQDSIQIPEDNTVAAPLNSLNSVVSVNESIELIAKLASLRDAGALSEEEFNTKKTELLSRI